MGLLTDVFPVIGYRYRPYGIAAGVLGAVSALAVAIHGKLPIPMALFCLIGVTTAVVVADVTIDACIARNSIEMPSLAPDMQSLCGFCTSVGALIGFSSSGLLIHRFGAQEFVGMIYAVGALASITRVLIYQNKVDSRYAPVKIAPSGFVLLKDLRPTEQEVLLMTDTPTLMTSPTTASTTAQQGQASAMAVEEEPQPPQPFEYTS